MGKVPKVKKREVSVHSRAARRGTDPSAPVAAKNSATETEYNPWMHTAQSAGISKKKKTKQLTRQQKARHAKGLERGDEIANKLEKKVADSKARGKKVQARRADWDDLNEQVSINDTTASAKSKDKAQIQKSVTKDDGAAQPMVGIDNAPNPPSAPVAIQSMPVTSAVPESAKAHEEEEFEIS